MTDLTQFPVGTRVQAPGGMTGKVIRPPTLKHAILVQLDSGNALAYRPGELKRVVPWPPPPFAGPQ
jgi:hypothetical protein